MEKEFHKQITYIVGQIRSAGYDPYAQLIGYIQTLDNRYITRRGNARDLILQLDMDQLLQYVDHMES